MEYQDKQLQCVDCSKEFTFTAKDQEFFAKKQFSEPKRCAECRVIKKQRFNSYNRGGDNSAR